MPAITITPASVAAGGSGYTLQRYYRRLADELGFYLPTVTTAQASVGEASRIALSTELRDDEDGYTPVGGRWLYVTSGAAATQQRRIVSRPAGMSGSPSAGYQGSVGAVMVSRPFEAPLAANTPVDITAPLPVRRYLGTKGLVECVNEALTRLPVEARVTITGNGAYGYDLADYPFLVHQRQTLGIEDLNASDPTAPGVASPYGYEIRLNGAERTLVTRNLYGVGSSFVLRVVVSADRLIHDGVDWTYRDNADARGLQGDTWMAACPESWVLAVAMVKALQVVTRLVVMDRTMSPEEKQQLLTLDILPRRASWARAAAKIKTHDLPAEYAPRSAPLVQGTSRGGSSMTSHADVPIERWSA
jgi:hypothetical protein